MDATSERRVRSGAANMREIVMGAQDNLTNVLAVVLGVAIGTGDVRTVALAGLAAGIAEAISMGGVLYTSTRAERDLALRAGDGGSDGSPAALRDPVRAALVTFAAALVAALIPLAPFLVLPFGWAMLVAAIAGLGALLALGAWTGAVTQGPRWRAGLRFVAIGGLAALGSVLVGALLKVDAA